MEMCTYCTLTPNIVKAVRETMAGAMNATVEMTGGHLDLSDISDKTILFVAVGLVRSFATKLVHLNCHFSRLVCCLSVGDYLHLLPCRG